MTKKPAAKAKAPRAPKGNGVNKILETKRRAIKSQSTAAYHSGVEEDKMQVQCRRALLDKLREQSLAMGGARRIFISYSGSGSSVVTHLKKFFERKKYEVVLGFGAAVQGEQYVVRSVIDLIAGCSCFLGVWTKTYECETAPYRAMAGNDVATAHGAAPSVWMPFELGIAMGFRKPCKIMFEQGMHVDFIEKPNLGEAKIIFEPAGWREKAEIALDYFESRVDARYQRMANAPTIEVEEE